MSDTPANLNPHIIDGLYAEALVLADEVRAAFDLSGRIEAAALESDDARIALSCEALRTTTRVMHAIAWLINQRAYLKGELSEFQLRRHGRLPPDKSRPDPANLALIDPDIRELIVISERFYSRIERLDQAWRQRFTASPGAIHRLRERLGEAVRHI